MDRSGVVLILSTTDTKGNEVLYLEACFKELGVPFLTLGAGIMGWVNPLFL